jgi:hypothetical protein
MKIKNIKELIMIKKGLVLAFTLIIAGGLFSCSSQKGADKSGDGKKTIGEAPKKGRAIGKATIFDDDLALARDRALDDARNKLVEKVLGSTVSGNSIVENFRLVSNVIESKSYGLVKNEEVIEEGSTGNLYSITIEGTVDPAVVSDAIKDALERYGKPRFMVLIDETIAGKKNEPGFTITEVNIQKIMGQAGFKFVDAERTQQLMQTERRNMTNAMYGNISNDMLQLLLNDVGADILIVGKAKLVNQTAQMKKILQEYNAGNTQMKSIAASIDLKAIDVYTGVTLSTVTPNSPGIGNFINIENASRLAIQKALERREMLGVNNSTTQKFDTGNFINQIIDKFVEAATKRQINLTVMGLDYTGMMKFRNQIAQRIRGVKDVALKGQMGNAAKVEVYFAGKTNAFLDELMSKSEKLGFKIEIKENFVNRAVLNVSKIAK